MSDDDRQALFDAVGMRMREVAALSVLYSQTLAARLGINSTDLECLDLVSFGSDVTPGILAEKTGLTTGAITTVIDRLERAGFVERRRDDVDRRKVVLVTTAARKRRAVPPGAPMRKVMNEVLSRYQSEQLKFLSEVLGELCEAARQSIAAPPLEKGASRPRKTGKSRLRQTSAHTST